MKIPTTTDIPQRYTWCLAGICYSSLAILPSFLSYAESYFNPAFLLENGTSVADLSRFERGNHQPAGVYRWISGVMMSSLVRRISYLNRQQKIQVINQVG